MKPCALYAHCQQEMCNWSKGSAEKFHTFSPTSACSSTRKYQVNVMRWKLGELEKFIKQTSQVLISLLIIERFKNHLITHSIFILPVLVIVSDPSSSSYDLRSLPLPYSARFSRHYIRLCLLYSLNRVRKLCFCYETAKIHHWSLLFEPKWLRCLMKKGRTELSWGDSR